MVDYSRVVEKIIGRAWSICLLILLLTSTADSSLKLLRNQEFLLYAVGNPPKIPGILLTRWESLGRGCAGRRFFRENSREKSILREGRTARETMRAATRWASHMIMQGPSWLTTILPIALRRRASVGKGTTNFLSRRDPRQCFAQIYPHSRRKRG